MENLNINMLFSTFFISIACNFLTGSMVLWKNGEMKNEIYNEEKFRTLGECVLLLQLFLIYAIFYKIDIIVKFLEILLSALILNEGISITKNFHKLSVWTPKWWKKGLVACSEKIDSCVEKIDEMEENK